MVEYAFGRMIVLINGNEVKEMKRSTYATLQIHRHPFGSVKSTVRSRLGTSRILMHAFVFKDRLLDFDRYTCKIDRALTKLEDEIKRNGGFCPKWLTNRKHLLFTVKDIIEKIS